MSLFFLQRANGRGNICHSFVVKVFTFTYCTCESVILQHVSGEALTSERAWCVDTSVVADVALVYQALIHVLHLNGTPHCILALALRTQGEGFFREWTVRHYRTRGL